MGVSPLRDIAMHAQRGLAWRTISQWTRREDAEKTRQDAHGHLRAKVEPTSVGAERMVPRIVARVLDGARQLAVQPVMTCGQRRRTRKMRKAECGGLLSRAAPAARTFSPRFSEGRKMKALGDPGPPPAFAGRGGCASRDAMLQTEGETLASRNPRRSPPHPPTCGGRPRHWRGKCRRGSPWRRRS